MNLNHAEIEKICKSVLGSSVPRLLELMEVARMFPELHDLFWGELTKLWDKDRELQSQLLSIAKKMLFLMENPNMSIAYKKEKEAAFNDQVIALLNSKEYLKAVKLVKEQWGWDLKKAKDHVDALAKDLSL